MLGMPGLELHRDLVASGKAITTVWITTYPEDAAHLDDRPRVPTRNATSPMTDSNTLVYLLQAAQSRQRGLPPAPPWYCHVRQRRRGGRISGDTWEGLRFHDVVIVFGLAKALRTGLIENKRCQWGVAGVPAVDRRRPRSLPAPTPTEEVTKHRSFVFSGSVSSFLYYTPHFSNPSPRRVAMMRSART